MNLMRTLGYNITMVIVVLVTMFVFVALYIKHTEESQMQNTDVIVTIDDYWLTFLIAVVLPAIVALVTNRWASGTLKAVVLIILSVLNGWLTSLGATNGTFELKAAVIGMFVSFITAVAFHYGLIGTNALAISGRDGAIAKAVPGGIGGGNPVE